MVSPTRRGSRDYERVGPASRSPPLSEPRGTADILLESTSELPTTFGLMGSQRQTAGGGVESSSPDSPRGEDLLHLLHDLDAIVWEMDLDSCRFTFVSRRAEEILGYPLERWRTEVGFWQERVVHPLDREWAVEFCRQETEVGRDHRFEYRALAANGRVVWLRDLVSVVKGADGRKRLRGVMIDITEQKGAEETLRHNEQRFRSLIESISDIVAIVDVSGRLRYTSPALSRVLGHSSSELRGSSLFELIHPDDGGYLSERLAARFRADPERESVSEARFRHIDGSWRTLQLRGRCHDLEDVGTVAVVLATDVTERKRANEELQRQRRYFARLFDHAPEAIALMDHEHRILRVNREFCHLFEYSSDEAVGASVEELIVPAQLRDESAAMMRLAGSGERVGLETVRRTKDGREIPVSIVAVPVEVEDGIVELYGIYRDLTERKRVEQALHRSEAHLRNLLHGIRAVVWECQTDSWEFTYISQGVEEILGYPVESWYDDPDLWVRTIHPEDRGRVVEQCRGGVDAGRDSTFEYRAIARDGNVVWLRDIVHVVVGEGNRATRLRGVILDITEEKRLEEQLWQAQKMEAVGRLAGGVAHDFNNVLTAIQGHVQLLADEIPPGDPLLEDVDRIGESAERAAGLTRQLLAFGRKQVLKPEPVDLNRVVSRMEKMLQRVVGEGIQLDCELNPGFGNVLVDPAQIEQVLLNLVLNGRDAMPHGGRLTIATWAAVGQSSSAPDGGRAGGALLEVRDTGTGMIPEVQERIFEPFFTTKESGKGTGLGLSTVYGIVSQSGGSITVSSELGKGTTFQVRLPCSGPESGPPEASVPEPEPVRKPHAPPPPASGTVLVVEDERAVRLLVSRVLVKQGYHVLEAQDGNDAIQRVESYSGPIDLVLTDVVMPGMGGRELAERLRTMRPEIPLLFMSGHTEDELFRRGVADGKASLLAKPFSPASLARRVEQAIGGAGE